MPPSRRHANTRAAAVRHRSRPKGRATRQSRVVGLVGLVVLLVSSVWFAPVEAATKKPTTAKSTKKTTTQKSAKKPSIASLSANRAKQAKLRKQRITAAANVTALKGEDSQVARTLSALNGDLKDQNAALGAAKRALADAETEVSEALQEAADTRKAIDGLSGVRQAAAIDAYVDPQVSRLNTLINTKNLAEASRSQVYVEVGNRDRADTLDQLLALEEDNRLAVAKAQRAQKKRESRKAATAKRLASLQASRSRTEKYAALVDDRLDNALYERERLSDIDAILAKEISGQQRELERQLAAARRNGAKGISGSGGRLPDIPTGSTNGIVVAASIRGKLAAMLAAASRDGVYLTGGGYRSSAGQIAVRRRNCGSSNYAVYQMPSSSCRPQTAKPGRSQHERGLAIDFTQNGRALRRNTSGYQWLRLHAAKYGFFNLPSEPWHWSTTGR